IRKAKLLKAGNKVAVLSTGFIGNNVISALQCIHESEAIAHYHFGFVKPLDEEALHYIFKNFQKVITLENGTIKGGFGSAILEFAAEHNYTIPVKTLGIPDQFIEHGTVEELQKICGMDSESLVKLLLSESL